MKNVFRATSGPGSNHAPGNASHNDSKSLRFKLFKKYGKSQKHQHNDCPRQLAFYRRLHSTAMEAFREEVRTGSDDWQEFFSRQSIDDLDVFNAVNKAFFPHMAHYMKKPLPPKAVQISAKLQLIAQDLAKENGQRDWFTLWHQLLKLSIRVKCWLLEDKISLYYRTFDGKRILGFDYPNSGGTKGGFVNAKCHFHGPGKKIISKKSLVLGEAVFVGKCTIFCSTIGDGCFTDVFAYGATLNSVQACNCKLEHCLCEEATLEDVEMKFSTVRLSTLTNCNVANSIFSKFNADDKRILKFYN